VIVLPLSSARSSASAIFVSVTVTAVNLPLASLTITCTWSDVAVPAVVPPVTSASRPSTAAARTPSAYLLAPSTEVSPLTELESPLNAVSCAVAVLAVVTPSPSLLESSVSAVCLSEISCVKSSASAMLSSTTVTVVILPSVSTTSTATCFPVATVVVPPVESRALILRVISSLMPLILKPSAPTVKKAQVYLGHLFQMQNQRHREQRHC